MMIARDPGSAGIESGSAAAALHIGATETIYGMKLDSVEVFDEYDVALLDTADEDFVPFGIVAKIPASLKSAPTGTTTPSSSRRREQRGASED